MYYQRSLTYRILDSFLRHRWLFLISVLAVFALIFAYGLLKARTYYAAYTVLLNGQEVPNPLTNEADDITWASVSELCNHFQSLVSTKEFIQDSLRNPDGTPMALAHPINYDDQDQLIDLQKNIFITPTSSDTFTVGLTTTDPDDALKILNALINTFIERNAQEKSAGDSENVAFIAQQLGLYTSKLSTSEAALSHFKAQNASHLPGLQDALVQDLANLQSQQQDLQNQITADNLRISYVKQELQHTSSTITANQQMGRSYLDTEIIQLQGQLDTAIAVKNEKPNHPEVIQLEDQIKHLEALKLKKQKSHAEEASGVITQDVQPNPEYLALQTQLHDDQIDAETSSAKLGDLGSDIAKAQVGVAAIPAEEQQYAELTRNYELDRDNYNTLRQRLTAAQIDEQLHLREQRSAYDALLTSPPQSSAGGKKAIFLYLGGLVLALLVGASLVVLSEWLDRSLRDPMDTQQALGVAVLAVLPEADALRYGDDYHGLGGPPQRKRLGQGKPIRALAAPAGSVPAGATISAADGTAGRAAVRGSWWRNIFSAGASREEAADS